jgi:ATP-dependent DNA helicase PIF1
MGKRPQKAAYVVFRGRNPGIYRTWPECDAQVTGFVGNKHQGYESRIEAERAWEEWRTKVGEKLQHVTSTREDVLQLPKSKDGFEMRTWSLPDLKRGNPYVDLTSSDDEEHSALKKVKTEVPIHYSPVQHPGFQYPPAQYPPVQYEAVPYPQTRFPHTQFPRPQYPLVQDTPMQNPSTQFGPVQKRATQDLEFQHPKTQPPANFKAVAGFDPFEAEEEEQSKPEDVPVVLTAAQQAVVEMAMKRKNIFLTGAAGSGKTATLKEILRRFKEKFAKGDAKSKSKFPSVQVIAPTGIAALPLDGKTTYSFAGW